MRTTVTIDDTLYEKALEMADPGLGGVLSVLLPNIGRLEKFPTMRFSYGVPYPTTTSLEHYPGLDKSDILRDAIRTFVRVQAAKRLAALGGKVPDMRNVPRRRGKSVAQ